MIARRIIGVAFAIVFTLCSTMVAAQGRYSTIHYGLDDGLPSNTVYGIFRDSNGFLWIGTNKGIARFNGIRFETFTTLNGLPDNEVFFFKEDKQGRIWMSTYNGKLCFYKNGVFHTDQNTTYLKLPFKSTYIHEITVENDGSVTFGFSDNHFMATITGERLKVYDLQKGGVLPMNDIVQASVKVSPDCYRLFSYNCCVEMDTNGNMRRAWDDPKNQYLGSANRDGRVLVVNDRLVLDLSLKPVYVPKARFLSEKTVHSFYFIDGRFFMLTLKGLYEDTTCLLPDHDVSTMREDMNGNYWIGTLDNGIYFLSKNYVQSRVYEDMYSRPVRYSYAQDGRLFYVAANENLQLLQDGYSRVLFEADKRKMHEYSESAFLVDSNFDYHFYKYYDNVIVKNILSSTPRVFRNKDGWLTSAPKTILSVNGKIYVKRRMALISFNIADIEKEPIPYVSITDTVTRRLRMLGMAKSPDNFVWFSDIGHIYKVVNEKAVEQPQFKGNVFKNFVFAGDRIVGLSPENVLIVCTNIEQAIKIDTVPPQGCIWDKLVVLDDDHVLIATNKAYRLLTLSSSTGKHWSIDMIDDPFIPINVDDICCDAKDVYFFKDGNITKLAKSLLLKAPVPPQLVFRYLIAGGRRYEPAHAISIPYRLSDNVIIAFTGMSFTTKDIAYEYSITKTGSDSWQPAKGEEINLVSPHFGTYTIKIRGRNAAGDFGYPIVFQLEIQRPYWATWWFIGLCAMAFTGFIILLVRYRINLAIRKKDAANENKIKFLKAEYKALNALMNPHFIFNTLNNVQGLINRNDRRAANEYLRTFADMIRQNMRNISKELIPLSKEIELVENYLSLEKLRFKELLNYKITIDRNVDTLDIMIPPLLIQPLVENSIKHGLLPRQSPDSMVELRVHEESGVLAIEVRDNGVGMNSGHVVSDTMHESYGLSNVKTRISQLSEILNTKIELVISEQKENGHNWTVVAISMRLPNESATS